MHGNAVFTPLALSVVRHVDAGHAVSNLLALAIFGPAVARTIGVWRVCVLLVVAGVAANGCAAWLLQRPVVGASGAVAAVAAAHLVLFPTSWLSRPIAVWVALQVVFALVALDFGGVAWPAHLVGAGVGVVLAWRMRGSRNGVRDGR